MKNVQIPEDLFFDICGYFLTKEEYTEEDIRKIETGLETKLEAMKRRALYSAYKDTKATPEAREAARQAYLDLVGMLPGYRWPTLDPPT